MPNAINESNASSVDAGTRRTVERLGRVAPAGSSINSNSGANAPPIESVSITAAARSLASLQDAVAATPDVDVGRVATISTAIQQGRYAPDPARIADRLLQLERDLHSASRRAPS